VKSHLEGDIDQDGSSEFLDAELSHQISTLLHNTRLEKLSGDGQKGERDQALFGPLTGRVIFQYNGKDIPASNTILAVSIIGAEAEYDSLVTTDQDGKFELRIHKLLKASSPNPIVKINFHLPQLALMVETNADDLAEITARGISFSFKMDVAASVKIFVRVLEEINGERQKRANSEATLIKALISQKYKVIDAMRISRSTSLDDLDFSLYYEEYDALVETLAPHATYAIVGLISSETSSTGTLNYATASAKLNLIDLSNGRILASGSQANIKAAGDTEIKANKSALRKCSYASIADIMSGLGTALE